MNWRKVIANERNIILVGSIAIASSGLYTFLLAGCVRLLLGIEERSCFLWVGLPAFVVLLVVHVLLLPKYLRKAGLLD